MDKPITLNNILASQRGSRPEPALTTASPNFFAPLASSAPGTESDDDTYIEDDTPAIMAPTPIIVNPTGASVASIDNTIDLNQFARDTCESIQALTGLLALANQDHKNDIANAYARMQALIAQLAPAIVANTATVTACTATINLLPELVVDAVVPKLTTTIHTFRDDLSMTISGIFLGYLPPISGFIPSAEE
jgi:hypothetical protein